MINHERELRSPSVRSAAFSLTALTPHSLNPNAGGARNQKTVRLFDVTRSIFPHSLSPSQP